MRRLEAFFETVSSLKVLTGNFKLFESNGFCEKVSQVLSDACETGFITEQFTFLSNGKSVKKVLNCWFDYHYCLMKNMKKKKLIYS